MIVIGIDPATRCGFAALAVHLGLVEGARQGLSNRSADGTIQVCTRAGKGKYSPELGPPLVVERLRSGRWDLSPVDDEDDGARFLRLWKRLEELREELAFADLAPDVVGLELPGHYRSNHATLVCFGVAAHVQSWAARRHKPHELIGISQVKVAATGGGKATGTETIAAVRRLLGYDCASDDEAEAILVALLTATRRLTT